MREVIYSAGVSLDGFIAGPGGDIGWTAPDEELHRFHNEQTRELALQLLGRRLYETMLVWETMGPEAGAVMAEFADLWRGLDRIVFSHSLSSVEGDARLSSGDVVDTVRSLKSGPGGPIAVGGATLAAPLIAAGLIDDYRMFVYPVVLGAGTPYFPSLSSPQALRLEQTRVFGSRVVYLRYRSAGGPSLTG